MDATNEQDVDDSSDANIVESSESDMKIDVSLLNSEDDDEASRASNSMIEIASCSQTLKIDQPKRQITEGYDETVDNDETLKAIISELKKSRQKPLDIITESFIADLSFHPEQNILAVGVVTGDIILYRCSNEENKLLNTIEVHSKACRTVEFSLDGAFFASSSRDKSIMLTDTETGKLKRFWDEAHDEPVYSMTYVDENLIATGDDEGTIKLWDIRQKDCRAILTLKEVEDYISCLQAGENKYLIATSGDGFLTTLSIPGKRLYVQSEQYEEELTSIGIFRNNSKLVVSTSKGNFYTYDWGKFGYHCDAFTCPSSPVTKLIPITERIAVTAGEEGIVRALHLVPGRVLGIVGKHSLAIEAIDINYSGELIASSSHDNDIKFWDIKFFENFDHIKYNKKPNTRRAMMHNLPSSNQLNQKDFFFDLA